MNNLIPILTINKEKKELIKKLNSLVLQGLDIQHLTDTNKENIENTYNNIQQLQLEVQQYCTNNSIYFNKINDILNEIRVSFLNKYQDYKLKDSLEDYISVKDNLLKIKTILYEFQHSYYMFTVLIPITYVLLFLINFLINCNYIYFIPLLYIGYGFIKLNWHKYISKFLFNLWI